PGVTFSHKLSSRTDALLIKRRRKLGPAKTKTLSRGLLYIYSYTHAVMWSRERLPPLDSLAWQSYCILSALKVTLKIRGRGSWQSINGYKITPNRIGLKPRIALSIRAYESLMTEKRSLKLL
ncbi:hypothetical protein TSAR_004429, partial [Trichomalopsis sarcophagae]